MTKQPFRFTLFLLICLSIPLTATAQTVDIPDPNLRTAIENALGKASGDTITVADMATLTELFTNSTNISDLTGLEHATNLTQLGLEDNNITDISPLAGLTNLTRLRLWGNSISDISAVARLTNLTELALGGNNITDISAVAGLTNLTRLRLYNNSISDISPIVENTGLASEDFVDVRENFLNALSVNTHIPTLQSRGVEVWFDDIVVQPEDIVQTVEIPDSNLRAVIENTRGKASGDTITVADMLTLTQLFAPNRNISDLTGLEHATNLAGLWLADNSISDLSPVAGLTNLTRLWLWNNSISDISAIAGLTNLTVLRLEDNNISDISAVAGLTNLTEVGLYNNSITDISAVAGLTNLTALWLYNNAISDISAVAGLTNLTALWLYNNAISDISAVAGLTNLTELLLEDNNISDISAVAGLTNLTWLTLNNNSISDISAVAGLTNLTTLYLNSNNITDISAIAGLTNLTALQLENNNISDLSPLVVNTGLGSGSWRDRVIVSENPLNAAAINTHIPTLQNRGLTIQFDNIVVQPGDIDQTVVEIPDPNLRAAIENALGKASGDTITAADMATLTQLFARNANISDLTGLEAATNLITLSLGDNNITDISPVTGLTNLTFLWLEGNNITDISPLAGLTNLTVLGLWENSISDISPLAGLTILTELGLWENSILNLLPLVANTGLGNGDRVNVKGNPLSITSINTHISALKNRGVEVQFDGSVVQPEDIAQTVDIPDPNLRTAIAKNIGKASGDTITVEDMVTLTRLFVLDANISDLTGLEGATNLTRLTLWINSITDISPLAGLTNLTTLYLDSNNISDISPLAGLTQLTWLTLNNNSITDISPLAGLTNLTELELDSNNISDISPLVANTGLGNGDGVNVKGNFLNALSINTHIPALQSRGVTVEFDNIVVRPEDITQTVDIPDPNLRAAIENARSKASGATITVADMLNLTELFAFNISDLTGLEGAANLTQLTLLESPITDISALAGLTNLTELRLDSNNITDISAVVGLTNLTELRLDGNNITDISALAGLTNLTVLGLDNNSITDISAVVGLTNLTTLYLDSNNISDISPLAGLANLTELSLRGNSTISDISPLVENTGLGSGDYWVSVDVRGNFLNTVSINTHIPALQSRGVAIQFDNIVVQPEDIAQTVDIPDPNLRATIENLRGKTSGATITVADMLTLTELFAPNANISDLTGLESATNLTSLNLDAEYVWTEERYINSNSVSDLSPLAGLTNLTELSLGGNNITDISPLAELANLTELSLDSNNITDISPLAGLANLTELSLRGNSTISDISPLVANTGLGRGDRVNVKGNFLNSLSIDTHIPTLQSRGVTVQFDNITAQPEDIAQTVDIPDPNLRAEIENLRGKTSGATITVADMLTLTRLSARNANISDLTGLESATNLTTLYLDAEYVWTEERYINSNSVSDLSPLAGLTNLTRLALDNNNITDISPLAGLTSLTRLWIYSNAITDISAVAGLTNLTYLGLGGNNISDISPLEGLTNLTRLTLNNNSISDVSAVAGLTNLTYLGLGGNNISDISPLEGLTNLTELPLWENPLSNISPLAGLTNLTTLWLYNNSISDLSPIAGLNNLTELLLTNNSISDLSPLVANTRLGKGDRVNVSRNPLNYASIHAHIPVLQSRGVTVEFDDIVAQPADVNRDGSVNILDLVLVASMYGNKGQNLAPDVNRDGIVDVLDLVLVAGMFGNAAAAPSTQPQAPEILTAAAVQQWLTDARSLEVSDPIVKRGLVVLEQLLASLIPTETKLLANYPNPFNPETWIPYRLAEAAFVTLTIYDLNGQVVRTLDVGHRIAAVYESRSKAVYWDGRNEVGESVASGLYFYHLSTGDYSATRKMLILK